MKPVFLLIVLMLINCKKDDKPYMNEGVITGIDAQYCGFCGGVMINFHGDTARYSPMYYQLSGWPANLVINSKTKYPIYVSVDWQTDPNRTMGNWIILNRVKVHN